MRVFHRYIFKFHYTMWALMALCAVAAGALNKGYSDVLTTEARHEGAAKVMYGLTLQQITLLKASDL